MTAIEEAPLLAHLESVARRRGTALAVEDDEERLGYAALWERSGRVASALVARGLSGTRVGLLCRPGVPWTVAFVGVLRARALAVALCPAHPDAELAWHVAASGARCIVTSPELESHAVRNAGTAQVASLDEIERAVPPAAAAPGGAPDVPPGAALLLFTSGTTGRPKGAILSERAVLALARNLGDAWGFTEDDVLLHVLPLHHLHGIAVSLLVALAAGAATRCLPRFDAARVWEELGHATTFMAVPTQHRKLLDLHDAADPPTRAAFRAAASRLRLVTSGSAALPATVGGRLREIFGQYPLERYGMTEIGIVLSNPLRGERIPGSVGYPLPEVQLRIVGDGGEDVAAGESGELWVRAPTLFEGYDGNPVTSAAAFTGGWFRTGDTAVKDASGAVRLLGRTSVDILKSGGEKLSALEIEDALREHPAVLDVAVVGVPDDTWGDAAVAVVLARPGREAELEEDAVRAWAKARLAAYKVPKRVLLRGELPRNALGKVVKPELAREVADCLSNLQRDRDP